MLSVYTASDEEWVIAESPEDARDVYCAHIGCGPDMVDQDSCDGGCHAEHWEALPMGKTLTMRDECPFQHHPFHACVRPGCDGRGTVRTALTCAEWCAKLGRGYWGSANA